MLDGRGHVKLIDFGHTVSFPSRQQDIIVEMRPRGSVPYLSPERLFNHFGGRFSDWWAYGVVAFELLSGKSPWSLTTTTNPEEFQLLTHQIRYHEPSLSPRERYSDEARLFTQGLLCKNFLQRLGTRTDLDIKMSPFFAGIEWHKLEKQENYPALGSMEQPSSSASLPSSSSSSSSLTPSRSHQNTVMAAAGGVPTACVSEEDARLAMDGFRSMILGDRHLYHHHPTRRDRDCEEGGHHGGSSGGGLPFHYGLKPSALLFTSDFFGEDNEVDEQGKEGKEEGGEGGGDSRPPPPKMSKK
jgi:serine/threonine protein kinase